MPLARVLPGQLRRLESREQTDNQRDQARLPRSSFAQARA